MIEKKNEIPLSSTWLNDREKFDRKARSKSILESFIKVASLYEPLMIADIGCGTGSNALFLTDKIKGNVVWYLVEREKELLFNAKQRIMESYPQAIQLNDNTMQVDSEGRQITFHFYNETLEIFLDRQVFLHVMTCSALFDLFTQDEFSALFLTILKREILMYSVLNYRETVILPESEQGISYISKFESHMSRELAKGRPMGKNTMDIIHSIVSANKTCFIEIGESNWEIASQEKSFLLQNFNFYKEAILDQVTKEPEKSEFIKWLDLQHVLIEKGLLALKVKHHDFIIGYSDS